MTLTESNELKELLAMGLAGVAAGAKDMAHMDGAAAACNYIRIADLIASYNRADKVKPPVLDWGCGYGQVSWLLKNRGIDVISCDVDDRPIRHFIEPLSKLNVALLADPLRLPYESDSFGAVLSVGVLEHVGVENVEASLAEIARVLQPGGYLFIFMLPNRFSWVEFIADMRGVSVHPDKYSFSRIQRVLQKHSFKMKDGWRRNVLPRNLTGMSQEVKSGYGKHYRKIESFDRLLSRLPPFSFFSGVIEVVAKKDQSTVWNIPSRTAADQPDSASMRAGSI